MCDTTFKSTFPSTYTGIDIANANKYAAMKMLNKKMKEYNATFRAANPSITKDPLEWVHRYPQGKQTSYPCDFNNTNLNCYDGQIRIATKEECNAKNHYHFDPNNPNDPNNTPSSKNGWYLQWLPPAKTTGGDHPHTTWDTSPSGMANGDCYFGNYVFRNGCQTAFADPGEKVVPGLYDKLHFDTNTGECKTSQAYCKATGFNKYVDSEKDGNEIGPNVYGGVCELGSGQKAADFFGGNTFARGLIGGGCKTQGKSKI
jgi:hypothetical protein